MPNMLDYIAWRGDIPFEVSPFNAVDNIIFSQLAYLPLDGIVPGPGKKGTVSIADASAQFIERQMLNPSFSPEATTVKNAGVFFRALALARRYQHCALCGYESETSLSQEKQFSSLCVIIKKNIFSGLSLLAYRGTDASLVGWKEDFNMSYSDAVPAQLEASAYLEKMARRIRGKIMLAGHSKGGNLAVYAAACCTRRTRRRISAIYSNDAPGFHRKMLESEGYLAVRDRIQSFVPQSSFVGMLFEHGVSPIVINSTENGIKQHDLYSWEVTHNGLAAAEGLSQESRLVEKIINDWINCLDNEQRQHFIEALYMVLDATQAKSVPELTADWFKTSLSLIHSFGSIDRQTRGVIIKAFTALVRAIRSNLNQRPPAVKNPAPTQKPPAALPG